MADYEKYYKESIEVLTKYITDTRIIPTEKEWNKIAVKNNYLTGPSISYASGIKFPELCKEIFIFCIFTYLLTYDKIVLSNNERKM